jgi:threonine dehydratase
MSFKVLSPRAVEASYQRIKNHIKDTKIVESAKINAKLGHSIKFKLDNEQITGSFKIRGVLNTLLDLKERGDLPQEIVAFSTGNHAKAIAYAAELFGLKATIVMPVNVPLSKQEAPAVFNPKIILTNTRNEAEALVLKLAQEGAYLIPPSDHDMVIAGNGTVCYEAMLEVIKPDAVFMPCGGGGIAAGSYLATKLFHYRTDVFACEPLIANDAYLSVQQNKIFRFTDSPETIADGVRTLGISERVFHYLKQIAGFCLVKEHEIISAMIELEEEFGRLEPTGVLAYAAACEWLLRQKKKREVVVILTGGNISSAEYSNLMKNALPQALIS